MSDTKVNNGVELPPLKLFSYQHRHSDFAPSYYRLSSPSGLSLCLTNCDKDTEAFIAEANAALTENELLKREVNNGCKDHPAG